jgi:hypothetical protein
MGRMPTDEERELLATVRDDWIAEGLSTTPAEREKAQWAAWSAFREVGHGQGSHLYIWVDSPMAGVIAAAFIGFAIEPPLKPKLMKQLDDATSPNIPAANEIRKAVDKKVLPVRKAVHRQISTELETRATNAQWQRWKEQIGNNTWNHVWETIGDPIYSQGWEQEARRSGPLFEENLKPWADQMMEGQFSAGAMAQLDALNLLDGLDLKPFAGLQKVARNCCWWWAFDVGAVLCERPTKIEVVGKRVTLEFRDGWTVG